MVQLNLAGWAALLAPGVAVGVLMGYLLGRHVLVVSLAGALLAWLVGLVVDSLRWRASTILFSCPAVPVESLERLVQDLQAEGVEAVLEPGQISGIEGDTSWQIRSLMRHRDVIEHRLSHV